MDLSEELAVVEELIDMARNHMNTQTDHINNNQADFDDNIRTYEEVVRLRKLMQNHIKADLEMLQNEYHSCSGQSDNSAELEKLFSQEEQLKNEYNAVQVKQKEFSSICKSFEKQATELKLENEKLSEEKERRENETTVVLPLRREELSLFTLISGIRWDFEGSDTKVEGFITNKSGVKTFSFDKRICSQFGITNSLWDSMSED